MTYVTSEDKDAMKKILESLNGDGDSTRSNSSSSRPLNDSDVLLAGPGQVTSREIDAMTNVLKKLNNVMGNSSDSYLQEGISTLPELQEAMTTSVTSNGVKIGAYKIEINQDDSLLVNKQNYSVINKITGETIAHELGLYEAAHGLVKLLNSGHFVNSQAIRELLENEASYTSHKMDAVRYKRKMKKARMINDSVKYNLFEARCQSSLDRAMQSKRTVKSIYKSL